MRNSLVEGRNEWDRKDTCTHPVRKGASGILCNSILSLHKFCITLIYNVLPSVLRFYTLRSTPKAYINFEAIPQDRLPGPYHHFQIFTELKTLWAQLPNSSDRR